MPDDTDLVTLTEAAQLVGRKRTAVQTWAYKRQLVPVDFRGPKLSARFRRTDVLALAAKMDANVQSRTNRGKKRPPEPTLEELEAQIEERMRPENLPAWWDRETRAERARENGAKGGRTPSWTSVERFKELRARGLKLREIAELTGYAKSTISQILRGRRRAQPEGSR